MEEMISDRIKAHRSAPDVYDAPTFDQMADRIEKLEAKLPDVDWSKPEIYRWRAAWYLRHEERARTTLAELKGDKE
jgi:hypothetical protein